MRKSTKKPVSKKASANARNRVTIPADAKVTWLGKANPFRETSEAHGRVELVRKASGKTRATIEKIKGVRATTVQNLLRLKLVKFA